MLKRKKGMILAGAMSALLVVGGCTGGTKNATMFTEQQLKEIAASEYPIQTEETL